MRPLSIREAPRPGGAVHRLCVDNVNNLVLSQKRAPHTLQTMRLLHLRLSWYTRSR